MATGILGIADLVQPQIQLCTLCSADTFAVVTVNITNRNTASRDVRLAISATGTPNKRRIS